MNRHTATKVIVALSGGVDSAVAALRLLRDGYRVEALHMTNWDDDDGYCSAAADLRDARLVCRELGIALHEVNFAREYREQVFAHFLAEYRAGRTPNPDVLCNREIKFGVCLEYARRLGATALATGHYARRVDSSDGPRLCKGTDPAKDQSYFLHAVSRDALARAMFPVGELHKDQVRDLANAAGLPVFDKRDSTGICFIGERPFREFLGQFISAAPGNMIGPGGELLGRHQGLGFYTIGQRQGLGIGGRAAAGSEPWYVAGKNLTDNTLLVVPGRDHPALLTARLTTSRMHWIRGRPPDWQPGERLACAVRVRYRQREVAATIACPGDDGGLDVRFAGPVWAVTEGQYAVVYDADECLGGAVIDARFPAPAGQLAATA